MQTIGSPTPVATQDKFVSALTLEQQTADTLSFLVANASAVIKLRPFQRRGGPDLSYGPELLINPQTSPPIKNVSGVQFRSAVAGQPALIVAQLVGPEDPQIGGGTPFTQTLSATGQASQIGVITKMALANFPPANPADGTLIEIVINANGDEWLVAYNASTNFWDVISGLPLVSAVIDTDETTTSGTFAALATAGPSIVVPRPGDYYVLIEGDLANAGSNVATPMGYDVGAVAAVEIDAAQRAGQSGAANWQTTRKRRLKTGLTAGTTLTAKYHSDGANAGHWRARTIELVGRRIQ